LYGQRVERLLHLALGGTQLCNVEINGSLDTWEVPTLDCLHVFGKPICFAFKNGKPATHKDAGLGVETDSSR
jgi:hypothetical protein